MPFLKLENENAKLRLPFLLQKKVFLTRQVAGIQGRKLFFEGEKVSVALLFLLQEKGRLRKVPLGEPPRRIYKFLLGVWVHRLIFLVFGYVHLDHICD